MARLRFVTLGLVLVVAAGCATKPIAKEYRQEANAEDITFPMVLQNPDAFVGDTVLWGGVIIETKNIKNGTQITVLETPLGEDEKPQRERHSQGRFIALSSKFLDPAIYKEGRRITLAGEVKGKQELPLGDTTYVYPVVRVKQLHLWEKRPTYVYPYHYWDPYWDYTPWDYGPYWGWGPAFGYFGDYDEGFNRNEGREKGQKQTDKD